MLCQNREVSCGSKQLTVAGRAPRVSRRIFGAAAAAVSAVWRGTRKEEGASPLELGEPGGEALRCFPANARPRPPSSAFGPDVEELSTDMRNLERDRAASIKGSD